MRRVGILVMGVAMCQVLQASDGEPIEEDRPNQAMKQTDVELQKAWWYGQTRSYENSAFESPLRPYRLEKFENTSSEDRHNQTRIYENARYDDMRRTTDDREQKSHFIEMPEHRTNLPSATNKY